MVKANKKKHLKLVSAILSICLLFTAIIPTANASATGSFNSSCAGPAGLLKWLICPAIDGLTATMEGIYKSAEGQLVVPSSILTDGELDEAWKVSRDIANILFIILFLVVIFSQLTGIGIDNYGIKKILPRLIVCALLINLSFIICELLIDLSNIVGSSISDWLKELGTQINGAAEQSIPAGAYGVQLGAIAIVPVAATVSLGFLFALIIVLFHGIGASITLFFIAIVRKISIILIVALAPLAFAAYLLPNTEKLFKKWADWLKAILIIYPICSILVGGGALAGAVLNAGIKNSNTTSDIEVLAAMVAPLLPLWFLPKFLKGSLASLGALGQAVSNWREKRAVGRKRRARKAIDYAKSSQAYKSAVNTAKIRAMSSGAGQKISSKFGTWQSTAGGGVKNALKRGVGAAGQNALSATMAKAHTENLAAEQRNRENQRYADNTKMQAYINASGDLVSEGATGATMVEMTKGEYYRRMQEQRARQDSELYSRPEYLQQTNQSYLTQRDNATTKMYQENYARMPLDQLKKTFADAITTSSPEQANQIAAAIRTFAAVGQIDQARDIMAANSGKLKDFVDTSPENRNRLAQELGATGDWLSREYSKHLGTKGAAAKSFADWSDSDDLTDDKSSLAASLRKRGDSALDGLDKDSLKYITANANAVAHGVSDKAFAEAASRATDGEIVTRLSDAIKGLSDARRDSILANTSASQFVTMNENVRVAISGGNDAKWRAQVGEAIRDNPQIGDRLNADERARYAAPAVP